MAFGSISTVTVSLIVIYALVFSFVLVTDQVPGIPQDTRGLNLEQAFYDLHQIATRPHPFNSHANDVVRSYILSRLRNVTAGYPHVHIDDDRFSNASWAAGAQAVFFEGNNILVKVDGSDPAFLDKGGALFSAHWDSVSTAPGVTDDGIGVVTLMQLVKYFAKERQPRTAIFNINNAEEDGLRGAHVFLQHPWFKIPDTFLNLEGAAAGGRPILFRSTSTAATRSFSNINVPHPHGNVLSADAYALGVIRSRTDFSVYHQGLGNGTGIDGLDYAFYQGRSKYHTKYDSMPGANGAKESLWAMLETSRGVGIALLSDEKTHAGDNGVEAPVYFDLFGRVFFVFTQHVLLIFDIGLLVVGPLFLLLLYNPNAVRPSWWLAGLLKFKGLRNVWPWAKFWVVVIIGFLLQAVLVVTFLKTNKYIFHAQPYAVLTSLLSLAYLSTITILNTINPQSPNQQKHTLLVQMYIFTWVLHLIATIFIARSQVGGFYFFTAWNLSAFLSTVFDACARPSAEFSIGQRRQDDPPYQVDGEIADSQPTERTPLITPHSASDRLQRGESVRVEVMTSGWWSGLQLVVLTVPIALMSHILVVVVDALGQTFSDGSNPVMVYGGAALLSFLIVLPIAPFSLRIHPWVSFVILLAFVVSTITALTTFPFSQDAPLTVFFQQRVTLDITNPANQIVRAVTTLSGVPEYIEHTVISQLPSSWSSKIECEPDPTRPGLSSCMWDTDLFPSSGSIPETPSTAPESWVHLNATRLTPSSALLRVKGTNTRTCKVFFDSRNVTMFDIYEGDDADTPSGMRLQPGYEMPIEGFSSIAMNSRTWDKEFAVKVGWNVDAVGGSGGDGEKLRGRVACEWAEYESATIGGISSGGKIPALEELLTFMPRWVVVSKTSDGLLEAWSDFVV